ncbi:hypothetical protein AAY473_009998 [Plecturocebus cupreus]
MGPADPIGPVYSAPGSAAPGAGKRAAPAKRVALATHVASLPGLSRSVGNKNSSENKFHYVGQAGLKLLTSGDPPASAPQSATIIGGLTLAQTEVQWHNHSSLVPQKTRPLPPHCRLTPSPAPGSARAPAQTLTRHLPNPLPGAPNPALPLRASSSQPYALFLPPVAPPAPGPAPHPSPSSKLPRGKAAPPRR